MSGQPLDARVAFAHVSRLFSDTSGISVCFGTIDDPAALTHAKAALDKMHAKWTDKIQIDTTHFVCTRGEGPSVASGSAG